MVGVNLLTNRRHQAVNFRSPETGCSRVTVIRVLPSPLIVVSALLGGCNTNGSFPFAGSSEPEADESADLASTLLLVEDPATPLLVAMGFSSKPLIDLLDNAERGVGRCGGRCLGRYGGVSVPTSIKRFYRKRTRRTRQNKKQRTNTKRKAGNFGTVSSVRGMFWAVFSIGGTFWANPLSAVPFGR